MTRLLFLGEGRSRTAIQRNWTWESGHLAGKTLRDALARLGLVYGTDYWSENLWDDTRVLRPGVRAYLLELTQQAIPIIALGHKVARCLASEGVPHTRMIHPAARGAIRKQHVYQAHVQRVLMTVMEAYDGTL